jgi:hypothetical protein
MRRHPPILPLSSPLPYPLLTPIAQYPHTVIEENRLCALSLGVLLADVGDGKPYNN